MEQATQSAKWLAPILLAYAQGCGPEPIPNVVGAGGESGAGSAAAGGSAGTTSAPPAGETASGGGMAGAPKATSPLLAGELYAQDLVPTFEITVNEACLEEHDDGGSKQYCEGSLDYVPGTNAPTQSFSRVGVRLKGWASFQGMGGKPAFKVKLDEYVSGTRLYGVRRLTLNNMVQDPSMVHEVMGYRFYRAAGIPAPLCNHARVFVNGADLGLYANVESLDDEFVERRWHPAPGNLYDITEYHVDLLPEHAPGTGSLGFELETNKNPPNTSDLDTLIAAVNGPIETFYEDAGRELDWAEFLSAAAGQAIIADWDGYFGGTNNYKLYHELASDRFLIFPWGIDQSFGANDIDPENPLAYLHYPIELATSSEPPGIVLQRCREVPACLEQYLGAVRAALDVFESLPLAGELEDTLVRIAPLRAGDTRRPYDEVTMQSFIEGMRTFVAQRAAIVRAELATMGAP